MKKITRFFIAMIIVSLSITACNNGNNSSEAVTPPETPADTPAVSTDESAEISLSKPSISLSYVTEPIKNRVSCNGLLETPPDSNSNWECNFYTYEKLGYGTKVTITTSDSDVELYYTLDGTTPTTESPKYTDPFELKTFSQIRVKAFNLEENKVSKIASLDVNSPYGTSRIDKLIVGDGVSGTYIIFEALEDKSGPDFTKQHYFLQIDDGDTTDGDGVRVIDIQSFDSYTEDNVISMLGSNAIFSKKHYESTGSWHGTLWTKDIFEVTELIQSNISARLWYDTRYLARYVVTSKYMENMENANTAYATHVIAQAPSGKYYALLGLSYIHPVFKSEDNTKEPSEAEFYMTAYEGYYINDEKQAVAIPEAGVYFSKINEETNYWQWNTNEYSE